MKILTIMKKEDKKSEEQVSKQTVEVDAKKLDALMDKLEAQSESIRRLESAASKSQLARYDSRNKKKQSPIVHLRTIKDGTEDLVILGWKLLSNVVEKDTRSGAWIEDQMVELILENDTKLEIPLQVWVKRYEHIKTTVKSRTETEDGNVVLTVETDDGRTYKVDQTFIN